MSSPTDQLNLSLLLDRHFSTVELKELIKRLDDDEASLSKELPWAAPKSALVFAIVQLLERCGFFDDERLRSPLEQARPLLFQLAEADGESIESVADLAAWIASRPPPPLEEVCWLIRSAFDPLQFRDLLQEHEGGWARDVASTISWAQSEQRVFSEVVAALARRGALESPALLDALKAKRALLMEDAQDLHEQIRHLRETRRDHDWIALSEVLLSLMSSHQLWSLARRHYAELHREVHWKDSDQAVALSFAKKLFQHRLIDQALFKHLLRAHPRRAWDIGRAARRFGVALPEALLRRRYASGWLLAPTITLSIVLVIALLPRRQASFEDARGLTVAEVPSGTALRCTTQGSYLQWGVYSEPNGDGQSTAAELGDGYTRYTLSGTDPQSITCKSWWPLVQPATLTMQPPMRAVHPVPASAGGDAFVCEIQDRGRLSEGEYRAEFMLCGCHCTPLETDIRAPWRTTPFRPPHGSWSCQLRFDDLKYLDAEVVEHTSSADLHQDWHVTLRGHNEPGVLSLVTVDNSDQRPDLLFTKEEEEADMVFETRLHAPRTLDGPLTWELYSRSRGSDDAEKRLSVLLDADAVSGCTAPRGQVTWGKLQAKREELRLDPASDEDCLVVQGVLDGSGAALPSADLQTTFGDNGIVKQVLLQTIATEQAAERERFIGHGESATCL